MLGFLLLFVLISAIRLQAQCNLVGQWDVTNTTCPNVSSGSICCSSLTGGTPPYSCSISPNVGQWTAGPPECFTQLPAGTYTITTTDAVGCVGTSVEVIGSTYSLMTVDFSMNSATCGQANGSVCATIGNGSGDYSFEWTPQLDPTIILSNTSCLANALPAIYRLKVTDNTTSCIRIFQTIVDNISVDLNPTVTSTNSDCVAPNCNGTAIITPDGGTAPYTLSWSSGGLPTSTHAGSTITLTDLCPNSYSGTVTDANGCSAAVSFTVGFNGADVVANSTINGVDYHTITTNTIWDAAFFGGQTDIVVATNVYVAPGVTLTIDNLNIYVVYQKGIYAAANTTAGAEISGKSANFYAICGPTWRGFMIRGTGANSSLASRARLNFNNCSIQQAECGIRNYRYFWEGTNPNSNAIYASSNSSGGRIYCIDTRFLNNVWDVQLIESNYPAANYAVYFENCSFHLSSLPPSEFAPFNVNNSAPVLSTNARITMREVNRTTFFNCRVVLLNPNYDISTNPVPIRTHAVRATGSQFTWTGNEPTAEWDQNQYSSSIIGFQKGIRIAGVHPTTTLGENGIQIHNTVFSCYQGIETLGAIGITPTPLAVAITNNIFNDLPAGYNYWAASGTFVFGYATRHNHNHVTGAVPLYLHIAHNQVNYTAGYTSVSRDGIVIEGTGPRNNFAIRNQFYNCRNAFHLLYNNKGVVNNSIEDGLHVECNQFFDCRQDLRIIGQANNFAAQGIHSLQANFYSPSFLDIPTSESAGNRFTLSMSSDANDDIFALNVPAHTYFYHPVELNSNGITEMTPNVMNLILQPHNPCTGEWDLSEWFQNLQGMQQLVQQEQNLRSAYLAILDGGQTDAKEAEILAANYYQAYQLYLSLLQESPNLSEEVMLAAIEKEYTLPKELLTLILSANPSAAKLPRIQEALDNRTDALSEAQRAQIDLGKTTFSAIELMAAQLTGRRAAVQKAAFTAAMLGEVEGLLLTLSPTTSAADYATYARYTMHSNYADGRALLQDMPLHHKLTAPEQQQLQEYLLLLDMHQEAYNTGALTEAQTQYLEELTITNYLQLGGVAYQMLAIWAGWDIPLPEHCDDCQPGETRSQRKPKTNAAMEEVTIYPNPVSDFVQLKWTDTHQGPAELAVYDMQGRVILRSSLTPSAGTAICPLQGVASGQLMLVLTDEHGSVLHKQLINKQ